MRYIMIIAIIKVVITIGIGIFLMKTHYYTEKRKFNKILRINFSIFLPIFIVAITILFPDISNAIGEDVMSSSGLGFIAAAISTGLATIGAGYAVGAVGSSALGAVSEEPEILGKTLIFVGLAEGIAIYGLIISILILGRL